MTYSRARSGPDRTMVIATVVVVAHGLALWALQHGLLRRAVELVVPVTVISEPIVQPRPVVVPPPAPALPPQRTVAPRTPAPPRAAPPLTAPATPAPAPDAPVAVAAAAVSPAPLPPIAAPAAPVAVAAAPVQAEQRPTPAPAPKLELPSSDADYLQNPKPVYPPLSKRLGEQGTVTVRVLIGTDGTAQQGEIQKSSGFDRLDQAALATVLQWRFVPGKRAGKPEAMWFAVPIAWVLK